MGLHVLGCRVDMTAGSTACNKNINIGNIFFAGVSKRLCFQRNTSTFCESSSLVKRLQKMFWLSIFYNSIVPVLWVN